MPDSKHFVSSAWISALLFFLISLALATVAPRGAEAAAYPQKAVQLIVPWGPGGSADVAGRIFASVAQKYLGKPVIVSDVAGASGQIGTMRVHDARPDGYTLMLASIGSQAIGPAVHASDKQFPYKWNDFSILGLLSLNPYACVVPSNSPYNSLSQLVVQIKKNPGTMLYSTAGTLSIQNMGVQAILHAANLPTTAATEIPYKGGGAAATAVIGHQVDFGCGNLSGFQGSLGQRLQAISTSTEVPGFEGLKGVKTVAQQKFPQLKDISGWNGIYGPPGLPDEVVKKWTTILKKIKNDSTWKTRTKQAGQIPNILTGAEAKKFYKDQYYYYLDLSKKLGLQISSK